MKKLLFSIALLFSLVCHGQIVKSGWTSTGNPATARAALGFSETNVTGINVTNTFTNFSVPILTIGTGSNAITLTPTNGTVRSDVAWQMSSTTSGTNTATNFNASSYTLNGATITAWPSGGSSSVVISGNSFTNSFFTNLAVIGSALSLGTFSNGYNSATWISTNNDALQIEASTNGGAAWFATFGNFNQLCDLRMVVQLGNLAGGTAAVSNLFIYSLVAGQSTGNTNDFTLQVLKVAEPVSDNDAASKLYADTVAVSQARTWASHVATANVRLARKELQLSAEWSFKTFIVSNELRCALTFAGNIIAEFSPGFLAVTNGTTIADTNGITINVSTNHPGPCRCGNHIRAACSSTMNVLPSPSLQPSRNTV